MHQALSKRLARVCSQRPYHGNDTGDECSCYVTLLKSLHGLRHIPRVTCGKEERSFCLQKGLEGGEREK